MNHRNSALVEKISSVSQYFEEGEENISPQDFKVTIERKKKITHMRGLKDLSEEAKSTDFLQMLPKITTYCCVTKPSTKSHRKKTRPDSAKADMSAN